MKRIRSGLDSPGDGAGSAAGAQSATRANTTKAVIRMECIGHCALRAERTWRERGARHGAIHALKEEAYGPECAIRRDVIAQAQTPNLCGGWAFVLLHKALAMTYFLTGNPQYHRRGVVSRPCSGWEGVGPMRYGRQEFFSAGALGSRARARMGDGR